MMRGMTKELFVSDYIRFTRGDYRPLMAFLRCIKNYELRFLWVGRKFQCSNTKLGKSFYGVLLNHYRKRYGLEIGFRYVGKGLRLLHPFAITVNDNAVLGDDVTLFKGVTIGAVNNGSKAGVPTIGSRVTIGANATVCGNVHIGDDAFICAGAFVNFDVPKNAVVIGNPGTIHQKKYEYAEY